MRLFLRMLGLPYAPETETGRLLRFLLLWNSQMPAEDDHANLLLSPAFLQYYEPECQRAESLRPGEGL